MQRNHNYYLSLYFGYLKVEHSYYQILANDLCAPKEYIGGRYNAISCARKLHKNAHLLVVL